MYVTVTGLWYTELIKESKGECTWMIFLVKYKNIVRFRGLFKSQWRRMCQRQGSIYVVFLLPNCKQCSVLYTKSQC